MNILKKIKQAFNSVKDFYLFLEEIVPEFYDKLKYLFRLYLSIRRRDQSSKIFFT